MKFLHLAGKNADFPQKLGKNPPRSGATPKSTILDSPSEVIYQRKVTHFSVENSTVSDHSDMDSDVAGLLQQYRP